MRLASGTKGELGPEYCFMNVCLILSVHIKTERANERDREKRNNNVLLGVH